MKVICERAALLDAVNLVSGVVNNRSPRPQLACVKFDASADGELTLTGTDAEITLRLSLARVDVAEPGQALIPADKLRQIVSAEDNEPTLTIETDGADLVHIRGEDAHFQLHGYEPKDFPPVPEFDEFVQGAGGRTPAKTVFEHNARQLAEAVQRTIFATARENSRYAINGVLLRREGKKLELVATDGRRLALCRTTLAQGDKNADPVSCIIPSKALNLLLKLIDDPEADVAIAIADNQAVFHLGGEGDQASATLSSNLVEGAFPPYEDVIPKDQDIRVSFDRDVLASAVRRAALLTNEESRGVQMSFTAEDKRLELTSRAPEMGEAQVRVELMDYEGADIKIGFNPAYLTDALKVIGDPKVVLELKASNKPGLVRSGSEFMYVVMPVNLQ